MAEPIATPEDAKFILDACPNCHGFYGASSMGACPPVALTAQDATSSSRRSGAAEPDPNEEETMSPIATLIVTILVLAIVVAIIVYLMNWLYRRSSEVLRAHGPRRPEGGDERRRLCPAHRSLR